MLSGRGSTTGSTLAHGPSGGTRELPDCIFRMRHDPVIVLPCAKLKMLATLHRESGSGPPTRLRWPKPLRRFRASEQSRNVRSKETPRQDLERPPQFFPVRLATR